MRNLILLIPFVFFCHNVRSQQAQFPIDFIAGEKMFPGMKAAILTPDIKKETGLQNSSGVVCDFKIISNMMDLQMNQNDVTCVYYEVFRGKKNDHDDAGVIIAAFVSIEALDKVKSKLRFQPNNVYMQKDNYLITFWSDESSIAQQATLTRLQNHYKKQLNAEVILDDASYQIEEDAGFSAASPMEPITHVVKIKEEDNEKDVAIGVEAPAQMPVVMVKSENDDRSLTESEMENEAYYYMNEKQYDLSIEWYNKVLKKNNKNNRAYYNITWIYATLNRQMAAIASAKRAIQFLPTSYHFDYYRFMGSCYTELDSLHIGRVYFEKAIALKPSDYLSVYNYGYNRFRAKDFARAIKVLNQALQMKDEERSNEGDIYFYIGTAYSEMGEMRQSLPYFDSAIAITTYESYYFNKAEAYSRLHLAEEGIKVCDAGILANPDNANLYFKRHQLYRELGNKKQSYNDIEKAYQLDPTDPDIIMDMGVRLTADNKVEEALSLYRKALPTANPKGGIYGNMATLFAKNKLTIDSAIYYHKKAISDMPQNFIPYVNYANTLKDLNRLDEAILQYQKAYELNDNNDVVIGNYAVAYLQSGKTDKAKEMLAIGLKKFPDDFEMNALRAQIALSEDKDYPTAIKYASTALKNIPGGKSDLSVLSIRANARQLSGSYADAIYDYLAILNKMTKETQQSNADIYSNIGYCYLYMKEYDNAADYFLQCLDYNGEIDAALGMVFVKYKIKDAKGMKEYVRLAKSLYPDLKYGAKGLKKLEAEGYHYDKELYDIVDEVF